MYLGGVQIAPLELGGFAVFGVICALIASSRGRNPLGWFFIGGFLSCFGLILLMCLPDLNQEQVKGADLHSFRRDNRMLKEQLRKDRMVGDAQAAAHERRLQAHDRALGIDTSEPADPLLPGPVEVLPSGHLDVQWFVAEGDTPVPVSWVELRERWGQGRITVSSLVWAEGMAEWVPVSNVEGLTEALRV